MYCIVRLLFSLSFERCTNGLDPSNCTYSTGQYGVVRNIHTAYSYGCTKLLFHSVSEGVWLQLCYHYLTGCYRLLNLIVSISHV
jgi:hypothetical protein